jgi:hypothetical protein
MAGKFSGVCTRIQTEIPEAYYVHCYAHCLNLAVVKSCQLPIVRNTIDTVKDVSYSNKSNHEAEILKDKFQLLSISITTSP